ncbi:hypothetical protein cypCar_00008455, partial [Cyprinus carpio]
DISTNILMLVLMSISAVLVLFSKRKKSVRRVDSLNEEEIGHFTMSYSVLYMLFVLLKVYVLHVSMRCFYFLKAESMAAVSVDTGNTVTVKLPSYDEALKMRAEDIPPSYHEA